MNRVVAYVVVGLTALASGGCGGNPLVGHWVFNSVSEGITVTETLAINGDGSSVLSEEVTNAPMGQCTGKINITGASWSSTGNTVRFVGNLTCAGVINCTFNGATAAIDCAMIDFMGGVMNSACSYSLTNNNMSLNLSGCTNDSPNKTYTRGS